MLNVRKLTLQNFLIFGEKQEIEFNGVGIRYVFGENLDITAHDLESSEEVDERDVSSGSGKSTLPIGLLFAWFGVVWKKDKIPLARVINKKHKKNCEVTVEFDKDGKDIYCVKRYREFKPYGNTVFLFKWNPTTDEWDNLSRADSDETQELIDKIVGVNYTTALKTILFSRDEAKDFLDLSNGERFKIFENIIQLNKFKEKFDIVDKKKKVLEKDISTIITDKEAALKSRKMVVDYLAAEKATMVKMLKDRDAGIKAATNRLKEIGDVDSVETQITSLVEIYKKQLSLAADFLNVRNEHTKITQSIKTGDLQYQKIESMIEMYTRELDKKPTTCDSCGEIQGKDKHLEHISNIKDLLEGQKQSLQHKEDELELLRGKAADLLVQLETIKVHVQKLTSDEQAIELSPVIKKIIYEQIKTNQPIKLHEEVVELSALINKLKTVKADYTRAIGFANDIRKLNAEIRNYNVKQVVKERELKICDIWMSVLDIREETSIKQLVISKIIPAFNSLLQETLDDIYNGLMRIQFDSFLSEFIEYEGDEAKKSELSTGERARINLCINLSVYELTRINLNASNVIFMDEVFNSMDVYSINKFIGLIKRRYAKQSLVHIVSHSKGVEESLEADQIIKIQRKDKESKIIFLT